MKRFTSLLTLLVSWALFCLLCPQKAYAYLDPGTGSYIFQLLIAGLLGAALAVKIFWGSVKAFFYRLFSKGQEKEDDNK